MDYIDKKYQWIKGDTIGKVEIVSEQITRASKDFLKFKGGNGIFVDILSEYMIEFHGTESEISTNNKLLNNNNNVNNNNGNIQSSKNIFDNIESSKSNLNSKSNQITTSPLLQIIQKVKSKEFKIPIKTSLPTKDLYDILVENYDKLEVEKLIIENIYNTIISEKDSIIELIEMELKKIYEIE